MDYLAVTLVEFLRSSLGLAQPSWDVEVATPVAVVAVVVALSSARAARSCPRPLGEVKLEKPWYSVRHYAAQRRFGRQS